MQEYNYKYVRLGYGPEHCYNVTVDAAPGGSGNLRLSFGVDGPSSGTINPHSAHSLYYEQLLNKNDTADLAQLMYNLNATCQLVAGLQGLLTVDDK